MPVIELQNSIIIHDGIKVIDRWETLVNPEKEIPAAILH
jgi:DNA polymerase-3 subunit epsilon